LRENRPARKSKRLTIATMSQGQEQNEQNQASCNKKKERIK